MYCRSPGPHLGWVGGKLMGLAWGVSSPHPGGGGELRGVAWGGLQVHTWVSQHALRQTPPPPDGHCSGQYASYWNVLLLKVVSQVYVRATTGCVFLPSVFNYLTYPFTHPHSFTQRGAHIATVIALLSLFIAPVITLS